jgi:hypothetical protein
VITLTPTKKIAEGTLERNAQRRLKKVSTVRLAAACKGSRSKKKIGGRATSIVRSLRTRGVVC